MFYKEVLSFLDKLDLHQVIYSPEFSSLYMIIENSDSYDLIFNREYNTPITIPKIDEETLYKSPLFYLDDDNVILDVNKMLILAVYDRLHFFNNADTSYIYAKHLKMDVDSIMKTTVNLPPFSENNKKKISHRIRIIKTYVEDKEKVYFQTVGSASWDVNTPVSDEDIRKYSKIFNDPIKVDNLTNGIYCWMYDENFKSIGYFSDKEKITSIYPVKSSLPERLRLHFTSDCLPPQNPEIDYLFSSNLSERKNALVVFCPIQKDKKPFKHGSPLKNFTLSVGEILITESLAQEKYFVRRTFQTDSLNVEVVNRGEILNFGDILAWDLEGNPVLKYDLNYKDAIVEDVVRLWNSYKIVLKVLAPLEVARLISETGLKGVTHPRKNLGKVMLPANLTDRVLTDVDMVIGPTSMKSETNILRLSWLALKSKLLNTPYDLTELTESELEDFVNKNTADLQKVKWFYNGYEEEVYVGLISFSVTDLAKDCKSTKIRIMPETLKYMYLSDNKDLLNVFNRLMIYHTNAADKWMYHEICDLYYADKEEQITYEYSDKDFLKKINNLNLSASNYLKNYSNSLSLNNIFFDPLNTGFKVNFKNNIIQFPSSKIVHSMIYFADGSLYYPKFVISAINCLISIKQYVKFENNINNEPQAYEHVIANIKAYRKDIQKELFNKYGALSKAVSPYVLGGHLKQLVSAHVPPGITVILDGYLNHLINDFSIKHKIRLFEIGVRNPVIWRFQFRPRKVWTFNDFTNYLKTKNIEIEDVIIPSMCNGSVLRNVYDTLNDKADTDGDLYPVSIPLDFEIQKSLFNYYNNHYSLEPYESEWIESYVNGELNKNKYLLNPIPEFKLHSIERTVFADLMADASIAKSKIGTATIDLWRFHAACEVFYHTNQITLDELRFLQFIFSKIVQDSVVEGVKHVKGGSSGYDIFAIGSIEENKEITAEVLKTNFNLSDNIVSKFIQIAILANDNEAIKVLSRLPNGGNAEFIASKLNTIYDPENLSVLNKVSYYKIIETIE